MTTPLIPQSDFNEITQLIHAARQRAVQAVNTVLIELYWQVGPRGFTRSNLFRMRKFYETYQGDEIVAPLVRQLPRIIRDAPRYFLNEQQH